MPIIGKNKIAEVYGYTIIWPVSLSLNPNLSYNKPDPMTIEAMHIAYTIAVSTISIQ